MKHLFFTIGLFTCLFNVRALGNDGNFPDVLISFYKSFQNAQNVSWSQVDDMLRIGFTLDGHEKFAFYAKNELVVIATEIKVQELPAALQQQLPAHKGYKPLKVYELNSNNEKEYCVIIDNAWRRVALKGKNKWKMVF